MANLRTHAMRSASVVRGAIDRLWTHNSFTVRLISIHTQLRVWMPLRAYRLSSHFAVEISAEVRWGNGTVELDDPFDSYVPLEMRSMDSAVSVSRFKMKNGISPLTFRFFPLRRHLISMNENKLTSVKIANVSSSHVHVIPSVSWKCFCSFIWITALWFALCVCAACRAPLRAA